LLPPNDNASAGDDALFVGHRARQLTQNALILQELSSHCKIPPDIVTEKKASGHQPNALDLAGFQASSLTALRLLTKRISVG
jgi:hypothetical protein